MKKKMCKILACCLIFILTINVKTVNADSIDVVQNKMTHFVLKHTISENFADWWIDFREKLANHPLETLYCYWLDIQKMLFGTSVQILANSFVEFVPGVTYSKADIQNSELNEKVNIGGYVENDANYEYQINIEDRGLRDEDGIEDEENRRFTPESPIPVITVDLYNMAIGDIELLDINFLRVDENHQKESNLWLILRNFTAAVIKSLMYVAIAILLMMLIYHAIQIVRNSLSNPQIKKEHMEGLKRELVALIMLIGTIVIMALCIYGTKMILADIQVKKVGELPIRVHVEEANYSFSTNITGYARYMSDIVGVNNVIEKAIYTKCYIALAWVNFVMAAVMFIRMLAMFLLAMLAPVVTIVYALNVKSNILKFNIWVRVYASLAAIQLFIAMAYRIFLEITVH